MPAESGEPGARVPYQPALDGVRALAVVAVLLYHDGGGWAPGGFLGVDAFFVLSGYLITSLLVREWRGGGRVDVLDFWTRRARRLLPALLLMLAGVAAYAAFVAAPAERHAIRLDSFATLFYVENWRLVLAHHSYFDQFTTPSPLRHAWSLAIEEQWYLVWPLALTALLRATSGRVARVLVVVTMLALASAGSMVVLYRPGVDPSRVYYGTDTRAQALLIGAALALVLLWRGHPVTRAGRAALESCGIAGAAFTVVLALRVHDTSAFLYRGGLTAAAVAVALAIAAAVHPRGRLLRPALSVTPLRALGLVSYGVYLFHWPIFLWLTPTRTGLYGGRLLVVRAAVTLAVAVVSYHLVDSPIRHGFRRRGSLRVALPVAACGVITVVTLATVGVAAPIPALASARIAATFPGSQSFPGSIAAPATGPARAAKKRAAPLRPAPRPLRVLVSGDSVAFTLGWTDAAAVARMGIDIEASAIIGCGIAGGGSPVHTSWLPQGCASWPDVYRTRVDEVRPDVSLLVVGSWELVDHSVAGTRFRLRTPEYRDYLFRQLDIARGILTSHGGVLVIALTPCFDVPVRSDSDPSRQQDDPARLAWLDDTFAAYAGAHPADVRTVDLRQLFCPNGQTRDTIDGVTMRSDGMHFTPQGAAVTWAWLAPRLRAARHRPAENSQRPLRASRARPK